MIHGNSTRAKYLFGDAEYLPGDAASMSLCAARNYFSAGSLTMDVHEDLDFVMRSFVLTCNITLLPGDSSNTTLATGDGFSVSYGEIAHGFISERGAGLGLRIQVLYYPITRLRVFYFGRELFNRTLPAMPFETAMPLRVSVHQAQLSFDLNGVALVSHLDMLAKDCLTYRHIEEVLGSCRWHRWDPQSNWRLVIGSRNGRSAGGHDLHGVHVAGSPHEDLHGVVLELSANTQQYTADSVLVSMQPVPTYGRFSPSTGASAGGTRVILFGTDLRNGSHYLIRYANEVVNATIAFVDSADGHWPRGLAR